MLPGVGMTPDLPDEAATRWYQTDLPNAPATIVERSRHGHLAMPIACHSVFLIFIVHQATKRFDYKAA